MRRILTALLVVLMMTSCGPKWVSLFDGETLTGWHVMNGGAKFEVSDGQIVGIAADRSRNTFLVSDGTYSDFILEFDFQTEGINSGVQLRSHTDTSRDLTYGYQFEIDPSDRAWTGGIYEEAGRGWLYRLYDRENCYVATGWNHARIEVVGNTIRTWVNGTPCANLIDDKETEGFIALQVHAVGEDNMGKTIRWRNIRIVTDSPEKYVNETSAPEISTLKNCLTPKEEAEGWKLLWDGATNKGWQSAATGKFPEKGWKIESGELIVEAHNDSLGTGGGGDIITSDLYGNFILKVDFKLTPGANSGIKYLIDPLLNKGQGASIGCEYQILDDNLHPDAKCGVDGNRKLASLYDLIPAAKGIWETYQIDGWNTAMIKVMDNHVEHWLNGVKVLEYDRNCDMWNSLVAYSKYHGWKGTFGNFTEGYVLLQDHNDEVHYCNIKIKLL